MNAKPQFPEFPESDEPCFWLFAWLRDIAAAEALEDHAGKYYARRTTSAPLLKGLRFAARAARENADETLVYVAKKGLLPFAFNGTTKTKKGGAR